MYHHVADKNEKIILKYLGFLTDDFEMLFIHQTFSKYYHFYGPVDTYSFYNGHGCFTLHHVQQRGEWGVFVSAKFSDDQYDLLEKEINTMTVFQKNCWTTKQFFRQLSAEIQKQINITNNFFGIQVQHTNQSRFSSDNTGNGLKS